MTDNQVTHTDNITETFEALVQSIAGVVLGKDLQIRLALVCLFARGHLLIEDIPGIGKTTLAKMLAAVLGLEFRRVQCTSDLLPGDILGIAVFDRQSGQFHFHPGPVFTHVLLADEINRTTPKTQSALLEAMEEGQVTVEGETRPLEKPFFVIATQNPLEQVGTYPLPESQLDRFLMRIALGYPDESHELELLTQGEMKERHLTQEPLISLNATLHIQRRIDEIITSRALLQYVYNIVAFTRTSPHFFLGLSPRAGLDIVKASRAWAFCHGRTFVAPEDVQAVLPYIVGHRLRAADDMKMFSISRLRQILNEIPIP